MPFLPRSLALALLAPALCLLGNPRDAFSQGTNNGKTFIDYFRPMPADGGLSGDAWGAAQVGPRSTGNGLEDSSMRKWNYWDGQIIRGKEGKYHLYACRWDQAAGHRGWSQSKAIHAVSDKVTGPYEDKGLLWPENEGGKGHNVTALVLPDGRYAVIISETRPGQVFVSDSPEGPWSPLGLLSVEGDPKWRASNESIMVRADGRFEMFGRPGIVRISTNGILGPYVTQGSSIYGTIPEMTDMNPRYLEDPVIWHSGGLYHVVVNDWYARRAYHLTSADGIGDWKFRGTAYDPTSGFARYADGTVNHWHKMERPAVLIENGHVVALSLASMDTAKELQKGNDGHGSKIVVLPFDGESLDRDLGSEVPPK